MEPAPWNGSLNRHNVHYRGNPWGESALELTGFPEPTVSTPDSALAVFRA